MRGNRATSSIIFWTSPVTMKRVMIIIICSKYFKVKTLPRDKTLLKICHKISNSRLEKQKTLAFLVTILQYHFQKDNYILSRLRKGQLYFGKVWWTNLLFQLLCKRSSFSNLLLLLEHTSSIIYFSVVESFLVTHAI